ncbi:glycosyltransferase family 87 protein [Paraburkholderia hospita]|uniref:glycosyltransferase family 87 protein n=1 Tax=Paraburkholderia hospita TaxID=169430 RepID=UPI003ECEA902
MNSIFSHKPSARGRPISLELPVAQAARRPHWINATRLRLYPMVALTCYLIFLVIYVYRAVWLQRADVGPLAMDFLPIWSASFLAMHGHAPDAYNLHALSVVEFNTVPYSSTIGGILPWLYPPNTLLFVAPLSLLPYKAAAVAFAGGSLALFVHAVHKIMPGRDTVLIALAFPGAALVIMVGQNGLLTAALAAFGLLALPRRPLVAGLCFGLLCMKPHLVLLFPLALLCSRSWRALVAFALTAAMTLVLAALVFGTQTYTAFLHNTVAAAGIVESGHAVMGLGRIPTVFALFKLAHAPTSLAAASQGISALLAAAAVVYAWRDDCSYPLRAAALVCASLLVSPYLYDYDLAWYGVVIAWYCRFATHRGWQRWEREWMVVLWLAPLAGLFVMVHLSLQLLPLVSAGTLAIVTRRIALERRSAPVFQRDVHQ